MRVKLRDIAQLQFGLYAQPQDQEAIAYLQARHFDEEGNYLQKVDTFLHSDKKSKAHLLHDGDILLVGKGHRNFAWTYRNSMGPAVASSIFYVIRVDAEQVLPEFLAAMFNMHSTQAHFQTLGAGSSIPSIRKSELEAFALPIPPMQTQKKIVLLKNKHYQELQLSQQLITEKQQRYQAVLSQLIKEQ